MRYAVISKGLSPAQLEAEVKKVGAQRIVNTRLMGQLFCEMDEEQAKALSKTPGLVLKQPKEYKADQTMMASPVVESITDVFYLLRSYFTPPLTGTGLTVAVLDSGIRKSHQALQNKVVYETNLTAAPSTNDVFGHGTQVAFVVAGGLHTPGARAGVSPGAALMNIKVINDDGMSSRA